jgi:transposase
VSALPEKLRAAILRARDRGLTYAETADLLQIGEATVSRVLRLHRETGSITPRPISGGNRSPIHGPVADLLRRIVGEMPDATVEELTDVLIRRAKIDTSRSGVMRALHRLGYSRKKNGFVVTERETPEHRARRREFCTRILSANARRLVFLDESYCKTGMRREYGWAPRGERSSGKRPMGMWRTVSLVGAIRLGSKPKLMTHRGSVNGRTFLRFVKHRLVPWLRRGDVVVMDNMNMHKMRAVRDAIEAAGAFPIYLPTYSPELNPIELWWGDMKRELRSLAISAEDQLRRAARKLLAALPLAKVAGWFRFSLRHAQAN